LYASSLIMRSTHSGDTWGMSLAMPDPSCINQDGR
jgi:hypothetical protein